MSACEWCGRDVTADGRTVAPPYGTHCPASPHGLHRIARPARRRSAWVDYVWQAWHAAAHAWDLQAEAATFGYATELAEYAAEHPRPTYRQALETLAGTFA